MGPRGRGEGACPAVITGYEQQLAAGGGEVVVPLSSLPWSTRRRKSR